jgi:SpoVK/Ycf46/Vps4 family AAA+-type ATPase
MASQRDLELILRSRVPIVVIETRDEARVLEMITSITIARAKGEYLPLFRWTVTDGLQRLDIALEPQMHNSDPDEVLRHIRAVSKPGVYILLDFHPYLENPMNIRLLKDICIRFAETSRHLVLVSHRIDLPAELESFSARFDMALPSETEREAIVDRIATEYSSDDLSEDVQLDPKAYEMLVQNLAGLTHRDTEQLARNAIYNDGAISKSDLPRVMKAKYELLNKKGILHFEYDTTRFGDIGGLKKLKQWLLQRKEAFGSPNGNTSLDVPKGLLLIGVQGCGKSLAAKATAGILGVPILRLDFGAIYNKYHGETERNLRESLSTATVMAPCVLWIDEIEKGLAGQGSETGTTQRILGAFLTWLSEKNSHVFVVATANDIKMLPPELIRKGRFDEIFFVDLPKTEARKSILAIHLQKRSEKYQDLDMDKLALVTKGFSGAEIEQAVVSALYAAQAQRVPLTTEHIIDETMRTRPLSVVMHERIAALRHWASDRTVACD